MVRTYFYIALFSLTLLSGAIPAQAEEEETENVCVDCHSNLEGPQKEAVDNWQISVHKKAGVFCNDCHGGDPTSYDEAMEESAGFLGKPKKEDIPALCAKCHEDAKKMRVYNLRTDQYSFYKESVHGQRLLKEKDPKVATCVDCHGNHAVFSKKDPRSPVHRPNITKTCAKCHSDKAYMADYGIPTDQYEGYLASYHGKLLVEKNDPRVPTCSDCHGGHGATQPGTKEVAEVCGYCHSVTEEYYSKSPHGRELGEGKKTRCIDCHGNHKILFPTSAKFTGHGENDCRSCHDTNSAPYLLGARLGQMLNETESAIHKGRKQIEELRKKGGTGFEISRLADSLDEAKTKWVKTTAMSHTLNMPELEKRTGEIAQITQTAREEISGIYKELNIRYVGLAVTWIFLLFLIWALNEKRKTL